ISLSSPVGQVGLKWHCPWIPVARVWQANEKAAAALQSVRPAALLHPSAPSPPVLVLAAACAALQANANNPLISPHWNNEAADSEWRESCAKEGGFGWQSKSGNNNQYKTYAVIDDDERNLWSSPHDLSHTEAVDDRMLQSWIQTRNQLEKDSEEWQKLNYEIYTLRQARREVRARWRRILEDLGFQKEAETLLSVTKQSTISNPKNMKRAMELLVKLSDNTTIFPAGWDLPVRYLYIMDRLICLDAVDDFLNIAQKKYPKTKMDISQ
uniref:Melanoregulin n=1 Tax=Xenopus tropicalis TaxID=8364 RepID=A0A6I8RKE8_XENTR